jgi:hypothetical protein
MMMMMMMIIIIISSRAAGKLYKNRMRPAGRVVSTIAIKGYNDYVFYSILLLFLTSFVVNF